MKKKIKSVLFVGVLAVILVVAAIHFALKTNNKVTITAVYEYAQICGIIDVIKEEQLLEKYMPDNVEVEWVMIDSGSGRRDALATGKASIAIIENTRIIQAIENGYPIRILANGSTSWRGLYTINPEIQLPEDLVDKKIAYMGTQDIILQYYFKNSFGIVLNDDQLLSVGEEDLFNMLMANEVDAVVLTGTMSEKAQALSNEVRLVHDLTPVASAIGVANWLVGSCAFFEQYPELFEPVMLAYAEAIDRVNNNTEEVAEMLAPLFEISSEQIVKEFEMFPPHIEIDDYDEVAEVLYEYGYIDNPATLFKELPYYETIPR